MRASGWAALGVVGLGALLLSRRREGDLGDASVCSRLTFDTFNEEGWFGVEASDRSKIVGSIEVTVYGEGTSRQRNQAVVTMVGVDDEVQRCGVATRLYEMALAEACKRGITLASDNTRTKYSEKFWKKQHRKKRATCVSRGQQGVKLNDSFLPIGKWPCHHYEMKEQCPTPIDLSGELGLSPPDPKNKAGVIFNPFTPEARRKRAAKEFLDVRAKTVKEVIPSDLPAHVEPFAEYMVRRSKEPLTGRDVVKAYLMTVGSIQRSAIGAKNVRAKWPDYPGPSTGKVRPEDVLGELLQSDVGQRYIDSAAAGDLDANAAKEIARRFSSFGFEDKFLDKLKIAPSLAKDAPTINKLIKKGRRKSWYRYVKKNVNGVGLAKSGFLAALLGRGDIATADARELNFWLCPINKWQIKKGECKVKLSDRFDTGDIVDEGFLEELNKKVRATKIKMPAKYKPFYEHLAHHTIWDAVGGSETLHEDIIEAMEKA